MLLGCDLHLEHVIAELVGLVYVWPAGLSFIIRAVVPIPTYGSRPGLHATFKLVSRVYFHYTCNCIITYIIVRNMHCTRNVQEPSGAKFSMLVINEYNTVKGLRTGLNAIFYWQTEKVCQS